MLYSRAACLRCAGLPSTCAGWTVVPPVVRWPGMQRAKQSVLSTVSGHSREVVNTVRLEYTHFSWTCCAHPHHSAETSVEEADEMAGMSSISQPLVGADIQVSPCFARSVHWLILYCDQVLSSSAPAVAQLHSFGEPLPNVWAMKATGEVSTHTPASCADAVHKYCTSFDLYAHRCCCAVCACSGTPLRPSARSSSASATSGR